MAEFLIIFFLGGANWSKRAPGGVLPTHRLDLAGSEQRAFDRQAAEAERTAASLATTLGGSLGWLASASSALSRRASRWSSASAQSARALRRSSTVSKVSQPSAASASSHGADAHVPRVRFAGLFVKVHAQAQRLLGVAARDRFHRERAPHPNLGNLCTRGAPTRRASTRGPLIGRRKGVIPIRCARTLLKHEVFFEPTRTRRATSCR